MGAHSSGSAQYANKALLDNLKNEVLDSKASSCTKTKSYSTSKKIIDLFILRLALVLCIILSINFRLYPSQHEPRLLDDYDPWFNYRSSAYLVKNGLSKFYNWFDVYSWYPMGRFTGRSVFPGMMYSVYATYNFFNWTGFDINVMESCFVTTLIFGAVCCIGSFGLAKLLTGSAAAGIIAAMIVPNVSHLMFRSNISIFENEALAVPCLILCIYMTSLAYKTGSFYLSLLSAGIYYLTALTWGGYVYASNITAIYAFILILANRYSERLYRTYTYIYISSTLLLLTIPVVGNSAVMSIKNIPSLGVFGLLQTIKVFKECKRLIPITLNYRKRYFCAAGLALLLVVYNLPGLLWFISSGLENRLLTIVGEEPYEPIVMSISENRNVTFDILMGSLDYISIISLAGSLIPFIRLRDTDILIIVLQNLNYYLSTKSHRFLVVTTPLITLTGITFLHNVIDWSLKYSYKVFKKDRSRSVRSSCQTFQKIFCISLNVLLFAGAAHVLNHDLNKHIKSAKSYIDSALIVLYTGQTDNFGYKHKYDDLREAYSWMRYNLEEDAKVLSWWDFGYQIEGLSNKTTYVDNNTNNYRHIALIGTVLSADEEYSYYLARKLDVDYVLLNCPGKVSITIDDIQRLYYITLIAQYDFPEYVNHLDYRFTLGEYENGNSLINSLIFRGCLNGLPRGHIFGGQDPGIPIEPPRHYEEVYRSKKFISRVYKIKKRDNLGRDTHKPEISKYDLNE